MTISNQSRDRVKKVFEPIALGMGRLGLTPDALTLLGFVITVIGAVLIAGQLWLVGGLVILFGGIFDMFDGTLARATGRVTTFGAFMDSVFDRAGEVIVYLGIIAGLQANGIPNGPLFAAAAMGGAVMVSYTRSKSEGLGFTSGTGMASIGIMPREIRLIVLSLGLIAAGALGKTLETLLIALAIIAIGATITVIQRILHVRSQAKSAPITTIQ